VPTPADAVAQSVHVEDSGAMRLSANRMLALVVGVVVILGIVVASLASSWTVSKRDPASPEGVVQAYLSAIVAHDAVAARAQLETTTPCTTENFQQVYFDNASRVDLVDVSTTGDRSTVHVRIEHGNGDPFGGTWTEEQFFELIRTAGSWRITGMPYPVYNCGVVGK